MLKAIILVQKVIFLMLKAEILLQLPNPLMLKAVLLHRDGIHMLKDKILSLQHTHNFIDSAAIVNDYVNFDYNENIKLYLVK